MKIMLQSSCPILTGEAARTRSHTTLSVLANAIKQETCKRAGNAEHCWPKTSPLGSQFRASPCDKQLAWLWNKITPKIHTHTQTHTHLHAHLRATFAWKTGDAWWKPELVGPHNLHHVAGLGQTYKWPSCSANPCSTNKSATRPPNDSTTRQVDKLTRLVLLVFLSDLFGQYHF